MQNFDFTSLEPYLPRILEVSYVFVLVLTIIASISFIFHWKKYGLHIASIGTITTVYIIITASLLLLSGSLLGINIFQ